jgi:hypothetical protein
MFRKIVYLHRTTTILTQFQDFPLSGADDVSFPQVSEAAMLVLFTAELKEYQ